MPKVKHSTRVWRSYNHTNDSWNKEMIVWTNKVNKTQRFPLVWQKRSILRIIYNNSDSFLRLYAFNFFRGLSFSPLMILLAPSYYNDPFKFQTIIWFQTFNVCLYFCHQQFLMVRKITQIIHFIAKGDWVLYIQLFCVFGQRHYVSFKILYSFAYKLTCF